MLTRVILLCSVLVLTGTGCTEQPLNRAKTYQYGLSGHGVGSLGIHTIRKGETLWSVANAYRVDLRDMLDLNRLNAPYAIKVGQRIRIPAPLTYRVRKGDTIYRVSRLFDTTTTELVRQNNLRAPYRLTENQMITLPSKHRVATIQKPPSSLSSSLQSIQKNDRIDREELFPTPSPSDQSKDDKTETIAEQKKPVVITAASPAISGRGFMKPVTGKVISGFGPKADGLHNDGINIKAARGDAVRSSENGVVVYTGNQIDGYGNLVLIRHKGGYMTAYAHMDKILVKQGATVTRGETIGTVGKTGNVSTPQLHFEIRKGREALNPADYL